MGPLGVIPKSFRMEGHSEREVISNGCTPSVSHALDDLGRFGEILLDLGGFSAFRGFKGFRWFGRLWWI